MKIRFVPPKDSTQPPQPAWVNGAIMTFDKPLGITSFQLVGRVRWLLTRAMGGRKLKVGHAGTLDPLASGVMVVCTGRATKLIDQLQAETKEYIATLRLGATTPSFDLEHEIDATYPTAHITRQMIDEVLPTFVGEIDQIPPSFSACKVEGKRAYDLARGGDEVQLEAKRIHIAEIEVLDCDLVEGDGADHSGRDRAKGPDLPPLEGRALPPGVLRALNAKDEGWFPSLTLRIVCGKGTYIRALARDIGTALGSGAHLTALRRTRVGDCTVDDSLLADSFSPENYAKSE